VSKDLFEQRIGETLRNAESTPPAGAWELIQSRIQTPYTPPFTFPSWAVVAISAALLGAMSFSDIRDEREKSMEHIALHETPQKDTVISKEGSDNVIEAEVVFASHSMRQEVAVQSETIDQPETEEVAAPKGPQENQEVEAANSSTTEIEIEESPKKMTPQLPVEVQANKPWTEELVVSSEEKEELPDEVPTAPATAFEPELSIEGVRTCYTPCELKLSASGNASEYAWDAASFGLIQGKSLNVTIDEPQSLTVYAIAKYADGAEKIIPQTIEVKKGSELFVPNSFTPNGDGVNDNFTVGGNGIVSFSMTIINSKGKVVFKTTDMSEAWNFSESSHELENEFYTAIVRAVGNDGRTHTANQRLTIIP
jgi:hypothetical protein